MMGNNLPLTAAIKKEMGDDTTVKTKCGMPFTVSAEVDGKTGNRECLPMYLSAAHAATGMVCKPALEKTAKNIATMAGGAPGNAEMER